ncbi:MAG: hypothetical protein U1E65_18715 [Myxococcota bacterium]
MDAEEVEVGSRDIESSDVEVEVDTGAVDAGLGDVASPDLDAGICGAPPGDIPGWDILRPVGVEVLVAKQAWPRSMTLLDNRIFWGNYSINSAIQTVDVQGCHSATVASPQFEPYSVSSDGQRVYWVQGGGELMAFEPSRNRTTQLASGINPYSGLAFVGTDIYSVGGDCVLRVVHSGNAQPEDASAAHEGRGLNALASEGMVLYSCTEPNRLFEFNPVTGDSTLLLSRTTRITAFVRTSTNVVILGEDTCSSFLDACSTLPRPGCCPGRIISVDVLAGTTSTIALDSVSSPISMTSDGENIYWSNFIEIRRTRTSSRAGSGLIAVPIQGYAESLQVGGDYLYWVNPNRRLDMVNRDGTIARLRLPR